MKAAAFYMAGATLIPSRFEYCLHLSINSGGKKVALTFPTWSAVFLEASRPPSSPVNIAVCDPQTDECPIAQTN